MVNWKARPKGLAARFLALEQRQRAWTRTLCLGCSWERSPAALRLAGTVLRTAALPRRLSAHPARRYEEKKSELVCRMAPSADSTTVGWKTQCTGHVGQLNRGHHSCC